jgi:hypothetical protein
VSRVYTQQELDGLEDLEERSDRETGTSGDKCDGGGNAVGGSKIGKELSLQASKSSATRYCVLKILNTS